MRSRTLDRLYHAIPLHYLPSLLRSCALYAASVLVSPHRPPEVPEGIAPRPTAARRDRALGLADYIHLSLTPTMPLLAEKLARGYSHALLVFEGHAVMALPEVGLVPYNTKAWKTRACYVPIVDSAERDVLLSRYHKGNRLPSLEILVKYGLSLTLAQRIVFIDDRERDAAASLVDPAHFDVARMTVDTNLFPSTPAYAPAHWDAIMNYYARCREAGQALSPPSIPFD